MAPRVACVASVGANWAQTDRLMKLHFQGNRLLDGLLVSCLIHLLVLVYAESGAETWMAQGPHASSDLSTAAPNDATCCVVVRLVMQRPPPSVPIEHTPGALLPLIPKTTASEPTPPKEAAANKTAASGMPLLPVAAPIKQTRNLQNSKSLSACAG